MTGPGPVPGQRADDRLVTPLFALITVAGLCYFLAMGSMLPTLPRYVADELGGGGIEVGIVVGAFAVSAALIRPTMGRFGDLVGRRTMTLAGAIVAGLAIAPLGAVRAVWFLVLLRLIAGLGEACFFVGAATAAQDLAPDHRRGEAASFFSISIYTGIAFGPVLGEFIYNRYGSTWTWLFAAGACGVSVILGSFIPGALGRVPDPPPRRGILHPAAILPGTVLLLGLLGFTGFAAFLPLYVDEIGVDDAGPFFLVYGVIVLVIRVAGARIPDRLGPVRASSISLAFVATGVTIVGVMASPTGVWIGTVLLAVGMSLLFPALFTLTINRAPSTERSHAVGTFSLFFDLSQGLGAPALGVAVTAFGTERAAFFAGAVVAVVGLVVANTWLRGATGTAAGLSPGQAS